jgi:hypothetical protein
MSVSETVETFLGRRVKDKVTSAKGVVTSVCFDMTGCVQAIVRPSVDKDGKLQDAQWFDTIRLEILEPDPVLSLPDFESPTPKGPVQKPSTDF